MEALGMIETVGLLAAIEAADVMTKSANIKILEKIYVGGGLVSITICGDIGAVKSSIDVGEAAVNNLGEGLLVSKHIIARPHGDLENIIKLEPEKEPEPKQESEKQEEIIIDVLEQEKLLEVEFQEEKSSEAEQEKIFQLKCEEIGLEKKDLSIDIIKELEPQEAEVQELESHEEKFQEEINSATEDVAVKIIERVNKENIDKQIQEIGIEKSKILLKKLNILEIRELIQEYSDLDLTDKFISKSHKKTLVKKIIEFYTKN